MEEEKIEAYYRKQAEDFIDTIYDKGFIATDCSRSSIRSLENLLAYYFQSQVKAAIKIHDLNKISR